MPERFLKDPRFSRIIEDAPYKLFAAYSGWLREQYASAGPGAERTALQEEADRLSAIYIAAARDLLGF